MRHQNDKMARRQGWDKEQFGKQIDGREGGRGGNRGYGHRRIQDRQRHKIGSTAKVQKTTGTKGKKRPPNITKGPGIDQQEDRIIRDRDGLANGKTEK